MQAARQPRKVFVPITAHGLYVGDAAGLGWRRKSAWITAGWLYTSRWSKRASRPSSPPTNSSTSSTTTRTGACAVHDFRPVCSTRTAPCRTLSPTTRTSTLPAVECPSSDALDRRSAVIGLATDSGVRFYAHRTQIGHCGDVRQNYLGTEETKPNTTKQYIYQ